MSEHKHTNRLIKETSPYLLQHAHNPVDWYAWGEEALEKSKRENKPILLSIGYSACHWCHVMERESFEDDEIARLMNDNFVCIKVDREERPDLDQIYMNAVQMMTRHGGWPLTVFLTPDLVPFYGGTYFPPEDRHQMPGFPRILSAVSEAFRTRPEEVRQSAWEILSELRRMSIAQQSSELINTQLLDHAFRHIARTYDPRHGGFGSAPKFPSSMNLEFLLRTFKRTGDARALEMATHTCRGMAEGGMYDQLGGGFHRYSTDARWLVPHFEKMLYDNALLSRLYLHVYQITGEDFFRRVVMETLDYVARLHDNAAEKVFAGYLVDVQVEAREERVVVEHLLEVGDEPTRVRRVAVEAAAELVIHAALGHPAASVRGHLKGARVAGSLESAEEEFEVHRRRELRGAAEAAVARVVCARDVAEGVVEQLGIDRLRRLLRDAHAAKLGENLPGRLTHLFGAGAEGFGDGGEDAREAGHLVSVFGREVGSAVEGDEVRREEDCERPAAVARHHLDGVHVNLVEVGALLAVNLDADEVVVHQPRDLIVLERLALHDVTPVAGRVADAQKDRLVLALRLLPNLFSPRVPVHRVVRVLKEVRAGLFDKAVRVLVLRHSAWRLPSELFWIVVV